MQLKICHSFAEMRYKRSEAYAKKKIKDYVFMSFCLKITFLTRSKVQATFKQENRH